MHYQRWKVQGDPEAPRRVRKPNGAGARFVHTQGYVMVYVPPEERPPGSRSHNFPEHRVVMARYLGRPLTPLEEVHHINGIRDDNRIENLQLRGRAHGSGQVAYCNACGATNISFREL